MKERVNFLSDEQSASFVEYEQRNSETKQRERRQQLLMSFRKKTKAGEYISVADFKAQLIAKGYLVSKFDVDKPDADGRTPLMKAAMNGDVESSNAAYGWRREKVDDCVRKHCVGFSA